MAVEVLENVHMYIALHCYDTNINDELLLEKGDIVLSSGDDKEGWSYGFSSKKQGWYPVKFVEEIDEKYMKSLEHKTLKLAEKEEEYKIVLNSVIDCEQQFLADYKSKLSLVVKDVTSRIMSSKLNSAKMISKWDFFLKAFEELVEALIVERNKPVPSQNVGDIYLSLHFKIYKEMLHYCQMHPYLIYNILANRKEFETAHLNKLLLNSVVPMTKFCSMIFMRLPTWSKMLNDLISNCDVQCPALIDLKRAQSLLELLNSGCTDVRKIYTFLSEIQNDLANFLTEDQKSNQTLENTIVFMSKVIPADETEEPSQPYLIFHVKKLFYGFRDFLSNKFKVIDVFEVESTTIEPQPNEEDFFNIFLVSCLETKVSRRLATASSNEYDQLFKVWDTMKESKIYLPFWNTGASEDIQSNLPTIPILTIDSQVQRPDKAKRLAFNRPSTEIEPDYSRLLFLVRSLEDASAISSKVIKNNDVMQNELTEKVDKLEKKIINLSKKLHAETEKRKNLELVVARLAKVAP